MMTRAQRAQTTTAGAAGAILLFPTIPIRKKSYRSLRKHAYCARCARFEAGKLSGAVL